MVDEFVYQFQSWQQYRGKLSSKGAEELEALRSCEHMWSILSVLNYLQALADKSGIAKELSTVGAAPQEAPQGLQSCSWQGRLLSLTCIASFVMRLPQKRLACL